MLKGRSDSRLTKETGGTIGMVSLRPWGARRSPIVGGVAAHEQAAPTAPRNAVNPGHRVFPIGLRIIRQPEELVQVGIGYGLGIQPWTIHTAQLDLGLGDHTRQA